MTTSDIAWTEVVRELSPGLLAYFKAVFPREVAADLVQETLLRLVMKVRAGKFQTADGSLRMYAYGIARLVRLEGRRSEGKILHVVDPDEVADERPADRQDDKQRLRQAVARLKPAEQEVILLLIDRDLALQEIATLLEVPVGTVKSHVHRAKQNLQEMLRETAAGER